MSLLLGFTLFFSAFLLFVCEPMTGKMVLPILGGAAAVWTTCVLFFQSMLLAGYLYAHLLGKFRRLLPQVLIHISFMLAALVFLPLRLARTTGHPSQSPVLWLLFQLLATAGVPFAVISATAPLLQNWLARTRRTSGRDPYFLYAASNAGSLLALFVYPIWIEPNQGVTTQTQLWYNGYLALLAMVIASAIMTWYESRDRTSGFEIRQAEPVIAPSWKPRGYWLAASFVPSALMLAVTNHISSNIGSLPLLWVIPLASYLLTFILAFAPKVRPRTVTVSIVTTAVLVVLFPVVAIGVFIQPSSILKLVVCHVVILFLAALLCHCSLADRRPAAKYLTDFYFTVALGGVLGGVFTAVIAPAVFKTVFEYPLLVALVPFFRSIRTPSSERYSLRKDAMLLVAFGLLIVLALYGVMDWARVDITGFSLSLSELKSRDAVIILFAETTLILVALGFRKRLVSFGIAFAMLVLIYAIVMPRKLETWTSVSVVRNFFGVKRVLVDRSENMIRLQHGDTIHGVESLDDARSGEPIGYYLKTGPLGDVMEMLGSRPNQRAGVVGLGAGTIAAYGGASFHVTFFEIDPQVFDIARRYFTFLRRCAKNCDVAIGDGRVLIEDEPEQQFDLLVLDAFNSDSIPAHLISREAVRAYVSKLKPRGVLLFHVPNRYLDIEKLAGAVAIDEGLSPYVRGDYVIAVRRADDLTGLPNESSWKALPRKPGFESWTDDYSNLMTLIRWQ